MNEVRMKKRILPAVLAFLMAVSLVPVSAFASTTTYADAFTVCVTGGDEDAKLDGASVDYTIEVDGTGGAKNTVTTTDGEAVIQEMADYAQDIADGKAVTLAYECPHRHHHRQHLCGGSKGPHFFPCMGSAHRQQEPDLWRLGQ